MHSVQLPPFNSTAELISEVNDIAVPNEPFIDQSLSSVHNFLSRELQCTVLDEIAPQFYVFCKRRSSHIDTLHDYIGTGRGVTITENPGLHLVRNYSVIYVKPIPHCLLNYAFWEKYLTPVGEYPDRIYPGMALAITCRSALGFLRTYGYLIQHESDFRMAQATFLIPNEISYSAFQHFIHPFRNLPDAVVSPRYQYGHIRLTRLNLAIRILRPKGLGKRFPWSYHTIHWHTGQYLARFAAPMLFLFACLTLILSSMQVGLAAEPIGGAWWVFSRVSAWVAVLVVMGIAAMGLAVVICFGIFLLNRISVGLRVNRAWVQRQHVIDLESGGKR